MSAQEKNEDIFLLNGLRAGSEEAFKTLFEKYSKRLYYIAFQYLNDQEESEEIVQEVFYKVWLNYASIKPELPFIPYLIRIAKNILINRSKRKLVESAYIQTLQSNDALQNRQTEEKVIFQETKKIVNKLVQQFPAKRKEIFILSRYRGFSNKEISEKLNISERTVENHINKGLKFLKEKLTVYGFIQLLLLLIAVKP